MEAPASGAEVSSEVGMTEEVQQDGPGGNEREGVAEELTETIDEPPLATASGSLSLVQSSLVPYRTPVLPNLAKAALERLKKTGTEDSESQNSDFRPLKRRKVEENGQSEDENEVTHPPPPSITASIL